MLESEITTVKTETVDRLRVNVYADRRLLGDAAAIDAARVMMELLEERGSLRVIFAAAPSQLDFFRALRSINGIDWSRITAFHMDEYLGLPDDAPQSFSFFLRRHLFDHVQPRLFQQIDSSSGLPECSRYGNLIREAPIDIVFLGIGENGHIAFNDPPVADFEDLHAMKSVELDLPCRQQQVNDGCFAGVAEVPTHALTLTIPALMSGQHLFCMVPGPTKRDAVFRTLNGPISTECPATVLRRHPNCRLYVDTDSYGL